VAGIDVVGMTARGWVDLPEPERQLIAEADVVVGGRRHLDQIEQRLGQQRLTWPSPLRAKLPEMLAGLNGRRVVALASGDPTLSGIGTTLVDLLGAERVRIHPTVSSAALARSRLGWSAENSDVITVVGRDLNQVRRRLAPGERLLVLSSDAETPAQLADLLVDAGYGDSWMVVLGDLGSAHERRREGRAQDWSGPSPALNLVGVICHASDEGKILGWSAGLPDEAYEHDGQLTKRDVRASALARLAPSPGELLWDLGAGAGSIAVEWARTDPRCRAIAVEQNPERAQRIGRNATRLGVPQVQVIATTSADALDWLPEPDAIFLGGGADQDTVRRCWHLLRPGGRIVVHAVTLETEAVAVRSYRTWGGELIRIALETAAPLGSFTGWQPARAVVQWSHRKPSGS
jgi:precorrin-6B C5,15-methyltransferase / cobalt-precorrin-6B C5,C15-methyltransferase